jgi:methylenetetrahydrofolate dehydrogenase (NADP+)/methenyltetrahydrofolate cyclohydrolase
MKVLNGTELAGYIKERQAKQVRALRQSHKIVPKLVIVQTRPNPVIDKYVGLKKAYGEDILIEVQHKLVKQDEALGLIKKLNDDNSVHGIIIQLPLEDKSKTDELVNAVAPEKDVDGLGEGAMFDPATPMAINWLLSGYNVELAGKNIVVVGRGRLVGAPLVSMWQNSGLKVTAIGRDTEDLGIALKEADVIVTAAGVSGLIKSDMIPLGAVVVDAATSSESGKIVGDVAPGVRKRSDLTITPERGGVGPLTVTALFDNVIRAARKRAGTLAN